MDLFSASIFISHPVVIIKVLYSSMQQFMDNPHSKGPPARQLRSTKSRKLNKGRLRSRDHLPSPGATNPSSTDSIIASSSLSIPPKRKSARTTQSLQARLLPVPKRTTPTYLGGLPTAEKAPRSKPSVASFFGRIEAALEAAPRPTSTDHVNTTTHRRSRSSSPTPEDLIKQLKEHYLLTASNLHTQATMRLAQTHSDLVRQLDRSVRGEADFLVKTEKHIKDLTTPLDKFRIRSQQRRPGESTASTEENSVGELIARAEEQVREFEKAVGVLWREWADAEEEVKGLLRGVGNVVGTGTEVGEGLGGAEDAGGKGEAEDIVKRFGEVVEREIAEAEEEAVELGEKAVGLIKDIEKDFRKTTLPDLHTFFQSIDEP
ncbi:hypothetical protein VTK26DRAFT_3008 [Humicola hyalothermophila]